MVVYNIYCGKEGPEWMETIEWKRALTVGRVAVLVPTS